MNVPEFWNGPFQHIYLNTSEKPIFTGKILAPFRAFLLKKIFCYVIIMVLHGTLLRGLLWHIF